MNPVRAAIEYLLGGPKVGGVDEERWRRWTAMPMPPLVAPHSRTRYVVVAAGTVHHALRHDRLVSIGAVGVRRGQLDLADGFVVALRQRRGAGLLGHPRDEQAPTTGVEPKTAMLDFLEYTGKSPLVAFRTADERPVFERAVKAILGVPFRHAWLDLAALLPALFPKAACATRAGWLDHFGIGAGLGHEPLGDAFATGELFLVALDASIRAGLVNAAQLIAAQQRPPPAHA